MMVVLLLSVSGLIGQSLEDIRTDLTQAATDSARFSLLLKLSGEYRFSRLDSAIAYGQRALALADQIDDPQRRSKAYYQLGAAYLDANQLDEALTSSQQALRFAKEAEELFIEQLANNLIGSIYRTLRSPEKALPFQLKALDNAREMGDTLGIAYALVGISNIYSDQRDTSSARSFLEDALALFPGLEDNYLYVDILINLSLMVKEVEEKKRLLAEAEKTAMIAADTASLIYIKNYQGSIFSDTDSLEEAIKVLREGLGLANSLGDVHSRLAMRNKLASIFLDLNELDSVAHFLDWVARDPVLEKDQREQLYFYRVAAEWSVKRGDYLQAYTYSQESSILLEKLQDAEVRQLLSDARIRYETAEKENKIIQQALEIKTEKRRRQLQAMSGGALALFLLALLLIIWQRRRLALQSLSAEQERRRQLEQLDQMKSRFFAQVSHELRTPLTLVIGPLEQLLEQARLESIHPTLLNIRRNARRLIDRVNELLDVSKLEAGKLELAERSVALARFLERVGGAFTSMADSHQQILSLKINIPAELHVRIDPDKVEKVLNNLLHNAHKFSGEGQSIWFNADWRAENLMVEVADSGPGFGDVDPEYLFGRYVRGTQMEGLEGTGLGLAIVQELLSLMGGQVKASNRPEGGAIFQVIIPAQKTEMVQVAHPEKTSISVAPEEPPPVYRPLGAIRPRVLVVEDQPELARFIQNSLQDNFEAFIASNGREALTLLQKSPADLIVSDIMMPDLDGFGLRQKLIERPQWASIPFVFLTARSLEEDRLQALRMGVDDYLLKPFSIQELRARLENLIKRAIDRRDAPELTENERPAMDNLIRKAEAIVRMHMDDSSFRVDDLAKAVGYSSRQLGRILKKETGFSPVAFLLELRLQEAYRLLQERQYFTVSEVRYAIGIESASYFSNKFTSRFGISPSKLLQEI